MTALVDTSVWSLALRRRAAGLSAAERPAVESLRLLIDRGEAAIMGPIRQELLSGLRDDRQFGRLRELLAHFPHIRVEGSDYNHAAECFNRCRRAGIATTAVDMLICAVALRTDLPIFSTDDDFSRYAEALRVRLLNPV